jgi:TatD DNase family protein
MIDTHCHLNFHAFENREEDIVKRAEGAGVHVFIIPGTDVASSAKAVELAHTFPNAYAAVGIHPHHLFESHEYDKNLQEIEKLLNDPRVVAVGEVGMDRHEYKATKYDEYAVEDTFITRQSELLAAQIRMAQRAGKSIIFHNRESKTEFLAVISREFQSSMRGRAVFHCCEPDEELLDFATAHDFYIGVDGDVTFDKAKQDFIKTVPIEMLVLETDAPFLTPEPIRSSAKKRPQNEPAHLQFVAQKVAELKELDLKEVEEQTDKNARTLFALPE